MTIPLSRRKFLMLGLGGIAAILDGCSNPSPTAEGPTILATSNTTPPVPPQTVARAFLDVWSKSDYAAMYQWLAARARARIGQDDFVKFYQTTGAEATITAARLTFISALEDADTATVQFNGHFDTALFGAIEEDNALALVVENNRWGIVWSPSNFLKDLADDNRLKLYPEKSTRGNIYDRTGQPLAVGQTVVVVNLWPAEMRRNQVEAKVLAGLGPILNLSQFDIQRK